MSERKRVSREIKEGSVPPWCAYLFSIAIIVNVIMIITGWFF